ncbi:hypothetical protein E4U42_005424 [Claviceps africana]|uniref:Post-SET domain-containing protein n=1 Tax=Claviceps africana TaxID=83212 RepID=A0A8K0NGC9_9HYPO|nr:hypothetical protein E4U42_005424 [Claviceps africana]
MAPLTPHWQQPSHPAIQEVIINNKEFTSKSLSKVTLPPFAVFAKLSFPPCTVVEEPTYATVQMGKNSHLSLNSDLLYINHSCEPSLIFDMASMNILAGPKGLQAGDELTFFYPSTEWAMAQPFTCLCHHPSCRGTISGAKDMEPSQLQGTWINPHIRHLLEQQQQKQQQARSTTALVTTKDATTQALHEALHQAEKAFEAVRLAVFRYESSQRGLGVERAPAGKTNGFVAEKDAVSTPASVEGVGLNRRGATSRELSGEMGGDTAQR